MKGLVRFWLAAPPVADKSRESQACQKHIISPAIDAARGVVAEQQSKI